MREDRFKIHTVVVSTPSTSRSTELLKGPYRKPIPPFPLLIRGHILYGCDRRFVLASLAIATVPVTTALPLFSGTPGTHSDPAGHTITLAVPDQRLGAPVRSCVDYPFPLIQSSWERMKGVTAVFLVSLHFRGSFSMTDAWLDWDGCVWPLMCREECHSMRRKWDVSRSLSKSSNTRRWMNVYYICALAQ